VRYFKTFFEEEMCLTENTRGLGHPKQHTLWLIKEMQSNAYHGNLGR